MRPLRKLFVMLIILFCFCEFFIYYVVQTMCDWPDLKNDDGNLPVKALIIADTHLLGIRKGHWFDKLRRESQMHRAFQAALFLHNPEVVFILGDVFDEGLWSSEEELSGYVKRFHEIFNAPKNIPIYVVAGNHDIGFHYEIYPYVDYHFTQKMKAEPVSLVSIRDVHFVLINSMAMEGDGCGLCRKAEMQLQNISARLKCAKGIGNCRNVRSVNKYSRPILMQHFPLFRPSDAKCNEWDSPPYPEKSKQFKERKDCLSMESTDLLQEYLRFRVAWSGHTHHGCIYKHQDAVEYTVASFNWRNRNDPSYILAKFTPDNYAVYKCAMPKESAVITVYIFGVILSLILSQRRFRIK